MPEDFANAKKLISDAGAVLVVSADDSSGDAAAASLALASTLRRIGKKVHTVPSELPSRVSFLDQYHAESQETVLAISMQGKEIDHLRYDTDHDMLRIRLALRKGYLRPSDVSLTASASSAASEQQYPHLIITIGVPKTEQLGALFPSHLRRPAHQSRPLVLNIDSNAGNEQFGHANLIAPHASSLSEIVYDLISSLGAELLDEGVATALLTGIICATSNFSHPKSGPLALKKSAQLLEKGADHQTIMRALYKSRPLSHIRLFGRALERINGDLSKELVWTTLTKKDFEETGTDSRALPALLEEFRINFWQFPSHLFLWESHGSAPVVKGLISSRNITLVESLLSRFEGTMRGTTALFIIREQRLLEAQQKILQLFS